MALIKNHFKKIIQQHINSEEFDEIKLKNTISNNFNQLETAAIDLVDDLDNFHNSLTSEQKVQLARAIEAGNKGIINGRKGYH